VRSSGCWGGWRGWAGADDTTVGTRARRPPLRSLAPANQFLVASSISASVALRYAELLRTAPEKVSHWNNLYI
jgi:hypothetical protein